MANVRNPNNIIGFRSPGYGFDLRDTTFVGDPLFFSEPELCCVGTVWNYYSYEIVARGQQDCIDSQAVMIAKNQERFATSRSKR